MIKHGAEMIEHGAETKRLNSTRTARPFGGPGSSSRIQMLRFGGVFDRFGAETIENGAETIENGAETIENGVVFDRFGGTHEASI